ncbi:hypothetical protein [Parasitella parasitica]|uniref:BZIP domain-containing protein n=1 Tax=Parasitella parasitica TaxID=35722 RepID=A0A0B7MYM7_9FUNG|nr:hypothetical protein [Parasitella parasitica]
MFKDTSYQQASTATLTPTKLLMQNSMQHNGWNPNQTSISELNSYMNDVSIFNQSANLFNQQDLIMPQSSQGNDKMASLPQDPICSSALPLTPPSPARETLPKKHRKKLLEKNREAAYRCRQKKKQWINSLEERSQTAETKNRELQDLVLQLREESIYLRNLLLTHGNCECDVVQAYLRRTSEQLSHNAGAPQSEALPTLVHSTSSVSGSESSRSSMSKKRRQTYDLSYNPSGFMAD